MSGTVNYPKVIDQLTDVIKELNVGFAPCGAAAPSEETRRADAVGLLKTLLSELEQGGAGAAAAEHSAGGQKNLALAHLFTAMGNSLDPEGETYKQLKQENDRIQKQIDDKTKADAKKAADEYTSRKASEWDAREAQDAHGKAAAAAALASAEEEARKKAWMKEVVNQLLSGFGGLNFNGLSGVNMNRLGTG
jgi:hypothetical protein